MEQPLKPPRTVTREEANALLSKVAPLVQQLQGIQRSIIETNQQLEGATTKLSHGNGYPVKTLREEIQSLVAHQLRLVDAFQSALQQLEDLGAVLKDLAMGLVDFYGVYHGELVCFCWKPGEEAVRFWHTPEAGYAGRQQLD